MSIFPRLFQRQSTADPQASVKELLDLQHRLEGQIEALKSSIVLLRNEWNDTLQKLAKLYDRTRKAQRVVLNAENEELPGVPAPNGQGQAVDPEVEYYRSQM